MRVIGVALFAFLLTIALVATVHPVSAYSPQRNDFFNYSETVTVNNGQGSYTGYTEQTLVTGMEQMNFVNGNNVSTSYSFSYQFSNNQGNSTSSSTSGNYTWSTSSLTYVSGTDHQVGYTKPVYVWFFMNPALPVGATFFALNTQFTVLSKNYSFQLPSEGNNYVQTIKAEGTGQYQRNDVYGLFSASYTWDEYFDPTTGYIVGYTYLEQDNGQFQGQSASFTYTDDLYLASSSYSLAPGSGPSAIESISTQLGQNLVYVVALAFVVILIVLGAYIVTRRRRGPTLPKHPPTPYAPPAPSSGPWQSKVDMGSEPSQQVVIRDVAKVNCKYCGTLIPTTVDRCPYCGGPRQ